MVKVYAVALAVGIVGLLVLLFGSALAENLGRESADRGDRSGPIGRIVVAGLSGFGMGGLSAEFSPLGFGWQVSALIAVGAATVAVVWVRFATSRERL